MTGAALELDAVRRTLAALRDSVIALRRQLHQHPELSGNEAATAARVAGELARCAPGDLVTELGGHGVAAVFDGAEAGPTVMLRAELDALPIAEPGDAPHRSRVDGVSHKCGHDGHMAILCAVAGLLREHPPARGRVVLLFQPAEEIGAGARAVRADPRYAALRPDRVFALHNLPGYAAGEVVVRAGAFSAASVGLLVRVRGVTGHASEPHLGKSPALAMAQIVPAALALPAELLPMARQALVTVAYLRLGDTPAFGTAPGTGDVGLVLRAASDRDLAALVEAAEARIRGLCAGHALEVAIDHRDPFPATESTADCVAVVEDAARAAGLGIRHLETPFPWSEDVGALFAGGGGALFGLGAGPSCPPLHHPDYDFPDAILDAGALALFGAARGALAAEAAG